MTEPAVVNASPLILLSRVRRLDLLRATRAVVVVPDSVLDEVRAKGHDDATARALNEAAWISTVRAPQPPEAVRRWALGVGETAVLSVALERPGALAVLDDLAGRRAAASLGIPVIGTAGIVLRAKRRGMIPACRPVLDALVAAGMYISESTLTMLLSRAAE